MVPADGAAEKLAELAANPVTASSVGYEINGEQVTTKLGYDADGDTAFAAMPHQQTNLAGTACELGTYPSSYGTLKLYSGNELSFTSPVSEPTGALDVESLSGAEKKELADQVGRGHHGHEAVPGRHLLRRQGALPRRDAAAAGRTARTRGPREDHAGRS